MQWLPGTIKTVSNVPMKTASEFYNEKELDYVQSCNAIGQKPNWSRKNRIIAWELAVECERLDEECCKLVEELRQANEVIAELNQMI